MRKLSLLTVLAVAVIATACSGETPPTDGAGPAGSPTPTTSRPHDSGAPETEHQQSFMTTTGQEVQRLFGTLLTAFRRADAAMLRSTMPRDLALLCPAESMEPWLLENGPKIQAFELASVFIDAEDPDRGMAQLTLLPERDAAKPLQVESAHWFPLVGVPFPLKREDGHWKVGYPIPHEPPSCPYQSYRFVPSETGVGFDFPNVPGLDFNMWHIPFKEFGAEQPKHHQPNERPRIVGPNVRYIVLNPPSYGPECGRVDEPIQGKAGTGQLEHPRAGDRSRRVVVHLDGP